MKKPYHSVPSSLSYTTGPFKNILSPSLLRTKKTLFLTYLSLSPFSFPSSHPGTLSPCHLTCSPRSNVNAIKSSPITFQHAHPPSTCCPYLMAFSGAFGTDHHAVSLLQTLCQGLWRKTVSSATHTALTSSAGF